jgi:hypothetical protein
VNEQDHLRPPQEIFVLADEEKQRRNFYRLTSTLATKWCMPLVDARWLEQCAMTALWHVQQICISSTGWQKCVVYPKSCRLCCFPFSHWCRLRSRSSPHLCCLCIICCFLAECTAKEFYKHIFCRQTRSSVTHVLLVSLPNSQTETRFPDKRDQT